MFHLIFILGHSVVLKYWLSLCLNLRHASNIVLQFLKAIFKWIWLTGVIKHWDPGSPSLVKYIIQTSRWLSWQFLFFFAILKWIRHFILLINIEATYTLSIDILRTNSYTHLLLTFVVFNAKVYLKLRGELFLLYFFGILHINFTPNLTNPLAQIVIHCLIGVWLLLIYSEIISISIVTSFSWLSTHIIVIS